LAPCLWISKLAARHMSDFRNHRTRATEMRLPSILRSYPRAFWISVCNVVGLVFSMVGVVLLFFFALPNEAPGGPAELWRNSITADASHAEATERHYARSAYLGLALVLVGSVRRESY
jgi:hypothetical protein